MPWGRAGWHETDAAKASRKHKGGDAELIHLELVCLELLTKARSLYALFDDETEESRKSSAHNSVRSSRVVDQ